MSGEDNPYLPPATDEPEALSGPGWKLMGLTLLVNHGATLPKVDLENGTSIGELKNVERRHRKKIPNFNRLIIAPIFLVVALQNLFRDWEHRWILPFLPAIIIGAIGYIRKSRKPPSTPRQGIIIIREFATPQRLSKLALKKNIKRGVLITVVASFIAVLAMSYSSPQPNLQAIAVVFSIAILVLVGLTLWEHLTRPNLKISDGMGDSIAISRIHPDAFEFLRRLTEEEHHPANVTNPHKPLPRPVSRNVI